MPVKKISLDQAKANKLFYFVANVVVYRESDGRCLILKRSDREKVHPGKWAVPGGKLQWEDLNINKPTRMNDDVLDFEDTIQKLIERETFEEAGIKLKPPLIFINDVSFIRPDAVPVVLVKFAARYKSGKVKLEKEAFSDWKWVNAEEVKHYGCILGIDREVSAAIAAFS